MELGRLKELLGIAQSDHSKDGILLFVMEDIEMTIKNYCNTKELPAGLIHTAYRMAMDLYRYEKPGSVAGPLWVSSISEGDTSTSFSNASDTLSGGILKDYVSLLNRYRKLGWQYD